MGHILGLRTARALVGAGVAALLLAAGCTQVVAGRGSADKAALAAYLTAQSSSSSSSSASAASASSSKAAAAAQAVCPSFATAKTTLWLSLSTTAIFLKDPENQRSSIQAMVSMLTEAVASAQNTMSGVTADTNTDIGKAASDYTASLADLAKVLDQQQIPVDDLQKTVSATTAASDKLEKLC